ncbi:MAG: D-aminoacyl-tRNA deacylase [Thermoplasmata archaeon]
MTGGGVTRILIVTSVIDKASMNILEHLLKIGRWRRFGDFDGNPAKEYGNRRLVTIQDEFLFRNDIDSEIKESLGIDFDVIVFASRHRSESGLRSLTVHPLGNYDKADFGGHPRTLVPTSPDLMTLALRLLRNRSAGLDFSVSFEVTHHGPYVSTPAFNIEIGSDEIAWEEKAPAEAIAAVVMSVEERKLPVAIGVGGGHYAPRITDVAIERNVSFGHMIPTYALDHLDLDMLEQVIDLTPKARYAYLHRKAMSKPKVRELTQLCEQCGLRVVRTRDLK